LILDEPTSGVGPLGRADLWATIHDAADDGAGVLVTTHHMDEAEQCDRLTFLDAGKEAVSGTVAEILAGRMTVEAAPADPAAALALLEGPGSRCSRPGAISESPGPGWKRCGPRSATPSRRARRRRPSRRRSWP
jgi:ABC-type multidrug transport system ATPase subunit